MMKYVFVLVLLMVGGVASVLGLNVGYRWFHNMTESARIMPGERAFSMPPGSVPRGGELRIPKEDRETAALRRNPIAATPPSVQKGAELFAIYCTPCHGARGKGDGLVAAKFVPAADLTNADLQKARTDGYWQSYLSVGGAVMPSYGEALSAEERWHVVNFLRTLAQP
jgi:S-disulfanyl-L-cysteine oxidoreductase SoxD